MEVSDMSDNLLTPKQVAERLRVSPDTVKRMLRNGEMPGFRLGGQWRIPEDKFEEWIQKLQAGSDNAGQGE
jgi:excisionase family DNA binding protein